MTILRLLEQMDIRKNGNTLRSIRQIFFDVRLLSSDHFCLLFDLYRLRSTFADVNRP